VNSCGADRPGFLAAKGTIMNTSGVERGFEITVEFLDSHGTQVGAGYDFKTLRDSQGASFTVTDVVPDAPTALTCRATAK